MPAKKSQVTVALGSDHGGYALKEKIKPVLESMGVKFKDFGCFSEESCDHPLIGKEVATAVSKGEFSRGILICSTGIGMSLAANKVRGIRAAVAYSVETAKLSREHNDANVLCLGARMLDHNVAIEMVKIWLSTDQLPDEKYKRRTNQIMDIECDYKSVSRVIWLGGTKRVASSEYSVYR